MTQITAKLAAKLLKLANIIPTADTQLPRPHYLRPLHAVANTVDGHRAPQPI
jgi:hypothetical protein